MINEVIGAYPFEGKYLGADLYGNGHINDTYTIHFQKSNGLKEQFIIQRINTNVFTNPVGLMSNIVSVTQFLRDKIIVNGGNPLRETLNLLKTKDGQFFYVDSEGGYWRAYLFIHGATSYENIEKKEDFYTVGKTFGEFQRILEDYPADTLVETIPNFHNTKIRFQNFLGALKADKFGRAKKAKEEIQFVLDHEKDACFLVDLLESGQLPLRVTHNDTKLNNIMIDDATGRGLCVIDLDTVMPGLPHYDYGDAIRFGASTGAEDEQDLSKIWVNDELFETFSRGYLDACGSTLSHKEAETLAMGARVITLECGMRFLSDYLSGDTYFRVHREGQNLDRARTQFKLVKDMESRWPDLVKLAKI